MAKKWATLETTGTDGTTIRQKNWDADHAKKTAENLRQSKGHQVGGGGPAGPRALVKDVSQS